MSTASPTPVSASTLRILPIGVAVVGLLSLRSWDSMLRFPADPGYHYILAAETIGLRSWVQLDPYLHVTARSLSWLASFAPIQSQAVVLAVLVHVSWAACGLGVVRCMLDNGLRYLHGVFGAGALALCPVAAESALGNVGNVKWPMLILAILVVTGDSIQRRPVEWSLFLGLVGATNPLSPILLLPLTARVVRERRLLATTFILPASVVILMGLANVVLVGPSRIFDGHGTSRVLIPWSGMGLFWWFGLLGPTAVASVYAALRLVGAIRQKAVLFDRITLVIPALSFVSYLFGGIADRYFVAPTVLAWIVAIPITASFRHVAPPSVAAAAVALSIGVVGITSIKWFSSSSYLRAGPTWSSEVARSRDACSSGLIDSELRIGDKSSVIVPCSFLRRSSIE